MQYINLKRSHRIINPLIYHEVFMLIKKYYRGVDPSAFCALNADVPNYCVPLPLLNSEDSKVTILTLCPTFFEFDFLF